ncbi:hypothetical protein TRFO_20586 [Tritrichomonas foetus]|uniref:Uncharacterized protein n=1 Tax=Tritrichomonas foetus TaxID=1144522 RepID=A0A1J4KGL6_9EUKA|nr:hypothetical protein TRFO_20586 [Tritrichomonas foetus]|eukprot:OHT10202.1 hypothetical protein TRFO_20586 [Tritrichomonas foetus]
MQHRRQPRLIRFFDISNPNKIECFNFRKADYTIRREKKRVQFQYKFATHFLPPFPVIDNSHTVNTNMHCIPNIPCMQPVLPIISKKDSYIQSINQKINQKSENGNFINDNNYLSDALNSFNDPDIIDLFFDKDENDNLSFNEQNSSQNYTKQYGEDSNSINFNHYSGPKQNIGNNRHVSEINRMNSINDDDNLKISEFSDEKGLSSLDSQYEFLEGLDLGEFDTIIDQASELDLF